MTDPRPAPPAHRPQHTKRDHEAAVAAKEDAVARDERQTERQAPDNASPGESAGG